MTEWKVPLYRIYTDDEDVELVNKVIRRGKVRRAKLYYLRERKGKSARIAEKIKKRIGVDVAEKVDASKIEEQKSSTQMQIKIEDENKANPKTELKKEDLKKEKK